MFWIVLILAFLSLCAFAGIIASNIMGVYKHIQDWTPEDNSELMKSYFCGTGLDQCKLAYKDAHELLRDRAWIFCGPAGFPQWIENKKGPDGINNWWILLSNLCMLLGHVEMIIRVCVGTLWLFIAQGIHTIILVIFMGISLVLAPVFRAIDRLLRAKQHCSTCYTEFNLPGFICPKCGTAHFNLVPGIHGIMVARCKCGKFLPASILNGRQKLDAVCPNPKCNKKLAANNTKQFAIQVIGGNSSGKTAVIAAFQRLYLENVLKDNSNIHIKTVPEADFEELNDMYNTGVTVPSSKTNIQTYNIIHHAEGSFKEEALVLYDIPDEVLISGEYEKNPILFKYSKGLILIIDPLSSPKVRDKCVESGEKDVVYSYDEDDFEDLITQFIDSFYRVTGLHTNKKSSIPISVVINKTDINSIGKDVFIQIPYFDEIMSSADRREKIRQIVDEKCKKYVANIGLENAVNILEGVFSNVHYFPISAIGHASETGKPFSPSGIFEPFEWVTKKEISKFHKNILSVMDRLYHNRDIKITVLRDDNMKKIESIVVGSHSFNNDNLIDNAAFYQKTKNDIYKLLGINLDDYWVKEYATEMKKSEYKKI